MNPIPTIPLPDAAAALAATLVVGQSLTLGGMLALRLLDANRRPTSGPRCACPDANAWLLIVMAAAAAQATGDLVLHLDLRLASHGLQPLTTPALLLFGPALWFYARAITAQPDDPPLGWRAFGWHALPALLLAALSLLQLLLDPWTPAAPDPQRSAAELALLSPVAAQMLVYMVAVMRRVQALRPRLAACFSNVEHRRLRWLAAGACTAAALVIVWAATWALPVAWSNAVSNGLMAAAVGILGAFGAHQRHVFVAQEVPAGEPPAAPTAAVKYAKSALPTAQAATIAARLQDLMRSDKPHLEHDLTLAQLAERVGVTPHQLSQVLSLQLGQSFFEYVNAQRVEAVKATLARPQSAGRPLLEIALECGFGSKSSFNEAFKRATGMSPSVYRQSLPASAMPRQAGAA